MLHMMRLKITSWTGAEWTGIQLSAVGSSMRVAVPGCDDATEFHFRGGQWFAENGDPAQIEFQDSDLEQEAEFRAVFDEAFEDSRQATSWLN
jgi:hypothetical protein